MHKRILNQETKLNITRLKLLLAHWLYSLKQVIRKEFFKKYRHKIQNKK